MHHTANLLHSLGVGPDFPIIIQLSQWKQQDFAVQMAKKLMGCPTISVGSVGLSGEFIASMGGVALARGPFFRVAPRRS